MCPDSNSLGFSPYEANPAQMSGLSLAFIGDSVYDVLVRSYVLSQGEATVAGLHKKAVDYANASFQAKAAETIADILTGEEAAVYKRGRNAHSAHTPKNKTEAEYHRATGFEALIGWLWLRKDFERISFLFSYIIGKEEQQ